MGSVSRTKHASDVALHVHTHDSIGAVPGLPDLVTDGTDVLRASNGHPYRTFGYAPLGAVTAAVTTV